MLRTNIYRSTTLRTPVRLCKFDNPFHRTPVLLVHLSHLFRSIPAVEITKYIRRLFRLGGSGRKGAEEEVPLEGVEVFLYRSTRAMTGQKGGGGVLLLLYCFGSGGRGGCTR
jgi:hypothetical protein